MESKTEGYGRKVPIKERETERIRTIRLADVINCLENISDGRFDKSFENFGVGSIVIHTWTYA